MRKLTLITGLIAAGLLGLLWLGTGIVTEIDRNRAAILEAQANIEQARAMQESARAAQEAAQAAQIASAGQSTVSVMVAVLFGMVLAAVIGFAALYVYLRFFRETPQPAERIHIPAAPRERLPQVDPQQAMLQQMTQMMMLEMLSRYSERLPAPRQEGER